MSHDCYPDLTETQRLIRDTARKVVERELKPHVQKPFHKMGTHSSPTGAVFLDQVRIPRENLLGGGTTEMQELTIARHLVNA